MARYDHQYCPVCKESDLPHINGNCLKCKQRDKKRAEDEWSKMRVVDQIADLKRRVEELEERNRHGGVY